MRFHSTPESTLNLEITKLAIIETVFAVVLYVSAGLYFGTFKYLALAVLVAPLMLLRTQVSAKWGLKIYTRFYEKVGERTLAYVLVILLAPFFGSSIRIISTIYYSLRMPLLTLGEISQNWLRQSFCIDFFHPPEIVPLEITKGNEEIIRVTVILDILGGKEDSAVKFMVLVLLTPAILIGYLPSLLYRISFKATSIVYLPLVFLAQLTLQNPLPLKTRLERITQGEIEKVRRGISWLIVTTLVAKLALVFGLVDLTYITTKFPSQKLMETLVVPGSWPWWQLTLISDALLTFFLLYFADAAAVRLTGDGAWRENTVGGIVSTTSFIRGCLSIFVISHGFYLALMEVGGVSGILGLLGV